MAKSTEKRTEIEILKMNEGLVHFAILGTTPFIANSMNAKVMQTLLMPPQKKNAAEKASTLKHDVMAEFQCSPYKSPDPKSPTLLLHLATAFKKAMAGAALDIPGSTSKAQIGRLCWAIGERIPIYGIPQLFMAPTRMADISHTPDVRTRAIVPEWACFLDVAFAKPMVTEQVVANLLAAAGRIQGTGDWRNEKGSGNYGQFSLVTQDDPDFKRIIKTGGRAAQEKAMNDPEFYNSETEELFGWYQCELKRRGIKTTLKAA